MSPSWLAFKYSSGDMQKLYSLFLDTFLHFAKKARPYESAANSSRIEGGPRWKMIKKLPKSQRKSGEHDDEQRFKFDLILVHFGAHLGPVWRSKCMQRSATNSTSFFIRKGDAFS